MATPHPISTRWCESDQVNGELAVARDRDQFEQIGGCFCSRRDCSIPLRRRGTMIVALMRGGRKLSGWDDNDQNTKKSDRCKCS